MPQYTSVRDSILQKLAGCLPEVRELFGVETLALFGSVSRGEDTKDSDIDILYRFSTPLVTLNQLMGLKEYLEELFGREVDLVAMKWIEPSLKQDIETDMILADVDSQ